MIVISIIGKSIDNLYGLKKFYEEEREKQNDGPKENIGVMTRKNEKLK